MGTVLGNARDGHGWLASTHTPDCLLPLVGESRSGVGRMWPEAGREVVGRVERLVGNGKVRGRRVMSLRKEGSDWEGEGW